MKEYNSKKVNTSPVGQSESEGADVDAVMKNMTVSLISVYGQENIRLLSAEFSSPSHCGVFM